MPVDFGGLGETGGRRAHAGGECGAAADRFGSEGGAKTPASVNVRAQPSASPASSSCIWRA